MSRGFALYQAGDSSLHRLDARVKLILTLCLIALSLVLSSGLAQLVLVMGVVCAMYGAGISSDRIRWVWRVIRMPVIMIGVFWVLFYPSPTPLFTLYVLQPGLDNLTQAAAVALRLISVALSTFLWLFTTNQAELVLSLVSLGLPYEFGLMLSIAFEQIPGLARTYNTVRQACMARGLDVDQGGLKRRIRSTYPILIATIISSLRRANELSQVMEARAMGASRRRTSLRALSMTSRDWWWLVGILVATAALITGRFTLGIAATPIWPLA